jgi:hypothetical protein
MDETTIGIIGTVVALGLLVAAAAFLERRGKTKGALFTGKPTAASRIVALILGLALMGLAWYQFLEQSSSPLCDATFPLAGIACLLYAIGINDLMRYIQQGGHTASLPVPPPPAVDHFTGENVERIVRRDYAHGDFDAVMSHLETVGGFTGQELYRIRLAVLKLANGSFETLVSQIKRARTNYRDVLIGAEGPPASDKRVSGQQQQEYLIWINRK